MHQTTPLQATGKSRSWLPASASTIEILRELLIDEDNELEELKVEVRPPRSFRRWGSCIPPPALVASAAACAITDHITIHEWRQEEGGQWH
jgi:hypothetical protein